MSDGSGFPSGRFMAHRSRWLSDEQVLKAIISGMVAQGLIASWGEDDPDQSTLARKSLLIAEEIIKTVIDSDRADEAVEPVGPAPW